MSGMYYPRPRTLWTLAGSGLGTTLTVTGNSGPQHLSEVTDVWLVVATAQAATGTTPTLALNLDVRDPAGNWITGILGTSGLALSATPGQAGASIGMHCPGPTGSVGMTVLPEYGRVTWTLGGTSPSYSGLSISLVGR